MSDDLQGDERYTFTAPGVIHKVYFDKREEVNKVVPDLAGVTYKVIQELETGYYVYAAPVDPSQPNPSYFIHKKYFVSLEAS